jgi:hypothetical protein
MTRKTYRSISLMLCLAINAGVAAAAGVSEQGDVKIESAPPQNETQNVGQGHGANVGEQIYARVNGSPITVSQYNNLFAEIIRDRFFHGKVPEGAEQAVSKEVTDRWIERVLLLEEARRRGFKPDESKIAQALAAADAKYTGTPMWKERDRLLAELRVLEATKSLLEQLDLQVTNLPAPTSGEIRDYYDQHVELFTVPEKLHLSVILLRVDPSASLDVWAKTYDDAQVLYKTLREGANFAELARQRSADKSAVKGGDLGYLHRGMLPAALHDEIDKLQVGVISEPIKGLEGFSIFRLEERVPARQQEFAKGESRARDLLIRERQIQARKELIEQLKGKAKIEILIEPKLTSN